MICAFGPVRLARTRYHCETCNLGGYVADDKVGLGDRLSRHARRLVCRLGAATSFHQTPQLLQEALGWTIADETVRHLCYTEAGRMDKWLETSTKPAVQFAEAPGDTEIQIDAGKVNTVEDGWRDFKVMQVVKRPRTAPATAADWAQRTVNRPSCSFTIGRIEEAASFGPRCRETLERLQIGDWRQLTLLADGGEWIWNLAATQFPGYQGILDVFHALQAISERSDAAFADPETKQEWFERARHSLLADGWFGLTEHLGHWLAESNTPARQAVKDAIVQYFQKHLNHLNYAHRLATGQTIGSGAIEGTIKQFGLRRLKASGVKWRLAHVNRTLTLLSLAATESIWDHYWLKL